ncbi:MAG: CD1247 N-terminal domain-containing protein [Acutalibacteraceae bacterium]
MNICEKISYIKGLAEGLGLDESNKNDKILKAVIDLLDDMAAELTDAEDDILDITDQVDAVDEDLAELEDFVFGDEDEDDEAEDDDYYQVTCPECGTEIYLDEDTLCEDSIACPECGTSLEFEFDEDDSASEEDAE